MALGAGPNIWSKIVAPLFAEVRRQPGPVRWTAPTTGGGGEGTKDLSGPSFFFGVASFLTAPLYPRALRFLLQEGSCRERRAWG